MFDYEGWATIREAFREEDEDDAKLRIAVNAINDRISKISYDNRVLELRYFNGIPRLWTIGAANRKVPEWFEVVDLFNFIADVAPGSYGLLSYWDSEEGDGKGNIMQVYVLKKGTLTLRDDVFLSPCIPEIEDFYEVPE